MNMLEDLAAELRNDLRPTSTVSSHDILAPENYVSITHGTPFVRNTGWNRECRIEMGLSSHSGGTGCLGATALFGCRAVGWIDSYEVALLDTGRHVLTWKRQGREATVAVDGNSTGRIKLGWWLRHAYVGSGFVWFAGEPFCEFTLPVFGPSAPQPHDCTGHFTFVSDQASIKFVIHPRDTESSVAMMRSGIAWGWNKMLGRSVPIPEGSQPGVRSHPSGTVFHPADKPRLAQLSSEQRLLLLGLAVWSWSLYKGGAT